MKNRRYVKHLVVALTAALVAVSIGLVARGGNAHGDTTTGTLVGEGGDAMTPVMLSLLSDDASQLLPDTASYTNVNLNQAISDFVGTAPGSFGADFAVSERGADDGRGGTSDSGWKVVCVRPLRGDPRCAHDPGAELHLQRRQHDHSEPILSAHTADLDAARWDLRRTAGHRLECADVPGVLHGDIDDDHHRRIYHDDHRGIDDIDHNGFFDRVGRAADRALWQRGPDDGELRSDDPPRQHFGIPNGIWGSADEIEWREPRRQHEPGRD